MCFHEHWYPMNKHKLIENTRKTKDAQNRTEQSRSISPMEEKFHFHDGEPNTVCPDL